MIKKFYFTLLLLFYYNITYTQVGIGTSKPDPSSVLDLESANKGISLPNVALTAEDDATTIKNPKKGLIVFKSVETNIPEGLYYNSGNSTTPNWKHLKPLKTTGVTTVKIPFGKADINKTLKLNDIEIRYNPDTKTSQIRSVKGDKLTYNVFIMENWKWDEGGSGTFRNAYSGNDNCKLSETFTNICRSTVVNTTLGTKSESNDIWIYIDDTTYHYYFCLVDGNYTSLILEKF